jgi:hypothetical protein
MLTVIIQNVAMLIVIRLSVIMPVVMAPFFEAKKLKGLLKYFSPFILFLAAQP